MCALLGSFQENLDLCRQKFYVRTCGNISRMFMKFYFYDLVDSILAIVRNFVYVEKL